MSFFGIDGPSLMIGEINAVRTKVTDKVSKTIMIDCHNDRLAIAAKNSCEETSSLRKFDNTDTAHNKYYNKTSVVSCRSFEVQNILNKGKSIKLKTASFTRWLLQQDGIISVTINFQNIIVDILAILLP